MYTENSNPPPVSTDSVSPIEVPMARIDLSGMEWDYVTRAFEAGEIGPSGPFRDRFERHWAARNGALHAITVSSGTAALHVGLLALGVGQGDEVIVPAMTYVATANAALYVGATPVFVDVDPETWCLSPAAVASAITPRTRVILPVHLFGHPCPMDELSAIAAAHDAVLFADGAHSPLAFYRDQPLGATAVMTMHSFFSNKMLTCGEGGTLLVNDDTLAEIALQTRSHGVSMAERNIYKRLGFNYRLSNMACAILCGQAERADAIKARCATLDDLYRVLLGGVKHVTPQVTRVWARRSFWQFPVVLERKFGMPRDQVVTRLAEQGIESRPFFQPLHHVPHLRRFHHAGSELPITERLGRDGLILPLHATMTKGEVSRVVEALQRCQDG